MSSGLNERKAGKTGQYGQNLRQDPTRELASIIASQFGIVRGCQSRAVLQRRMLPLCHLSCWLMDACAGPRMSTLHNGRCSQSCISGMPTLSSLRSSAHRMLNQLNGLAHLPCLPGSWQFPQGSFVTHITVSSSHGVSTHPRLYALISVTETAGQVRKPT